MLYFFCMLFNFSEIRVSNLEAATVNRVLGGKEDLVNELEVLELGEEGLLPSKSLC